MKIIFAAGGTAGHINPALAVADKLKEIDNNTKIMFIGTPNSLEQRLVSQAGYEFSALKMAGIQRSLAPKQVLRTVKALGYYVVAQKKAKKIIEDFKPDIVFGTGGYVTAPVLKAAVKMGIKSVTHESNSLPGIATKMLAAKVDRIYLNTSDSLKYFPDKISYKITGNPLRSKVDFLTRSEARQKLGLLDGFTILSFGGSTGANRISKAVARLISWESGKEINHIHSYGAHGKGLFSDYIKEQGIEVDSTRTRLLEYINNMYTCLCAADLVISRAGAMTLTELQAAGRATILVPYPNAAENHQFFNAKTLEKQGAAIVIEDKDLTGERLIEEVEKLMNNKDVLSKMEQNAKKSAIENSADIIVSDLFELIK